MGLYSTFHRYVANGIYSPEGVATPIPRLVAMNAIRPITLRQQGLRGLAATAGTRIKTHCFISILFNQPAAFGLQFGRLSYTLRAYLKARGALSGCKSAELRKTLRT